MLNTSEDSTLFAGKLSKKKRPKRKRGQQWAFHMESFKKAVDYLYEICRSEHNISACKEAIIYLENSKRDFESLINTINVEASWDESSKPQAVAWEIRKSSHTPVHVIPTSDVLLQDKGTDVRCEEDEDFKEAFQQDGWQLVLPRRRKSTSSSSEVAAPQSLTTTTLQQEQANEAEVFTPTRLSVYDRLSAPRRTNSPSVSSVIAASRCNTNRSSVGLQQARLTSPRSAMDLPQTKASMAKMAYSRQLLWERNQSLLAEKLRAKQRMERIDQYKRRSGPTRCGIHFATGSVPQNNSSTLRERLQRSSAPASESNLSVDRSLQSINEAGEGEDVETVPADPTPTRNSSHDNIRFSSTRSEPIFGEVSSLLGLDDDAEWREMTEEEESLALEEHSLNLEIEHEESFSIDIELERQVAAEAEALEKFELSKSAAITDREVQDSESIITGAAQQSGACGKNCGRLVRTWSEVVGKDLVAAYREPGTAAERHEKMSSPSRRRCDRNDADFSSRHAEKLRRASELRAQLQAEKTARLRELTRRVEEVREKRQKIIERKRQLLESRMERAQENREKNITEIIRRAKDDEQRVLEVQFINSLQGGNMLLDLKMRDAGVEERKQTIAGERARRIEEKAAKEHAAEERRKFAELERIARLQEIAEKKEARHAQLTAQRNEQERLRSEKRKQQQEKLTEQRLADAEENESLRKRIQEKIELSSRRHEQTLEEVRVRAQELSSPRPPSGCRWSWSFVDPNHWPSDSFGINFKCSICCCELSTELEAVAHVMSRAHLSITSMEQICVTPEDLEREFSSLTQSPVSLDGEDAESDLLWRKKRMKVKQRLAARNKKIANVEQTLHSSSTFQAKYLCELSNTVSKLQQKQNRLEDSVLQSFERVLSDAYREADCQGWSSANLVQSFSNPSLLVDLLSVLMKWTSSGASIRLLLKLSAVICRLCCSPIFCRALIFSPRVVELMDWIVILLKKPEQDAQLLCLLDVLCASIRCARNAGLWKILDVNEHELEIRISMIASYLLSCRLPHVLESIVVPSISSTLFTKLGSLHNEFAGISSEDTNTLSVAYCSLLLKVSICVLRSHSSSTELTSLEQSNGEVSARFLDASIKMCSLLSSDSRSWKFLMEDPGKSMRILLVVGCIIRRVDKESGVKSFASTALKLIAQYAAFDSYHQLSCILGGQRSILSAVATLPVYFLTRASLRVLFLTALITMTYDCSLATQLLLEELSAKHLIKFITEAQEGKSSNIDVLQMLIPQHAVGSLLKYYETLHP